LKELLLVYLALTKRWKAVSSKILLTLSLVQLVQELQLYTAAFAEPARKIKAVAAAKAGKNFIYIILAGSNIIGWV
jgi:hypothetical protein